LLEAAERVFVRDGYEGAQLAEIATVAGRTKGAVYAHYKSKEELFLALFEHRTQHYVARFRKKLEKCTDRKQRLAAFRDFYVELVEDKTWPILTLEYKLFAVRHPGSKERLRKTFDMLKPAETDPDYLQLFGTLSREQKMKVGIGLAALGPILSGLILESHFEPEDLAEKSIRYLLGKIFDSFFPARI
jgi:AcrR family transcriptional regulator